MKLNLIFNLIYLSIKFELFIKNYSNIDINNNILLIITFNYLIFKNINLKQC